MISNVVGTTGSRIRFNRIMGTVAIVILLAVLTLLPGFSRAYAAGDPASIAGSAGEAGGGVSVAIASVDTQLSTQTARDGSFTFANLAAGDYTVYVPLPQGQRPAADSQWQVSQKGDMLWLSITVKAGETAKLPAIQYAADVLEGQAAQIAVAAFMDSNQNGTRGPYERAIAGVVFEAVDATDATGAAAATVTTDANGSGTLAGLMPGQYVLRVTLPDGYLFTVAAEGWNLGNGCVGNSNALTAVSSAITLAAGQTAEAGAGAIPVGSFSGRVWSDINNDGVMQADEPGVADVALTLTGSKTGANYTCASDANGNYRFDLLFDDTYNFSASLPDGYLFARYSQTGGDARSVFTTEGTTATRQFIVTGAQNVTDKNVGVVQKATLSGIAFLDVNYNGVYDQGEPPYAGVTLEAIKNSNDKSMGKVVTGEDGTYSFNTLRGGDYRLRAILPNDGSIFTTVPAAQNETTNPFTAKEGRRENTIPSVTLANGATTQVCVGVAMGGTISGTVFFDKKYDGVQDGADNAASGVKVQLVDSQGNLAGSAASNANGHYTLEGIMPGEYTVRFQRKDGYAFSRYRPDQDNGNDVSALAKDGFGETQPIAVAMGQTIEQVNAGMLPSSTLTGVFFNDLNDNGLRDEGEGGFTDGSVRLLSEDGEIDLTSPVAEDGAYFFDGVMPGNYTVTFLLPDHATIAKVADGGNTLDAQGKENVLKGLTVESGKAYEAPLVGAVTLGSFEGIAYHDRNGNGEKDEGEETLKGVTVNCAPADSALQGGQAVTEEDGAYSITGLRPGQYTLRIQLPEGYIFSGNLTKSGIALDTTGDASVSCPWAALVNRESNMIGAVKPATITASIWLDENRNGTHAEDESFVSGLKYELYDEEEEEVVKTATSDQNGDVAFTDVRPGTYTLRFTLPAQAQPAEGKSDFTLDGSMLSRGGITVTEGETAANLTGGLVSYTSVGGTVTLDENGTHTPQTGVEVALYDGDGDQPLQTTTTNEQGVYRFDGLWPDAYRITVKQPDSTIFVRPGDPNYADGASIVTKSSDGLGTSDPFTVQMAKHQLSLNVILIKPARVGDQAWLDTNQNGLLDNGEPTINGVTVELLSDGVVAYSTQTNEWGYYEFPDVYPGTYTLRAKAYPALTITKSMPALRVISSCLVSGDGTSAESDPFSVESGTKNFDYDMGYQLPDGATMPSEIQTGAVQQWPAPAQDAK